MGRSTQTTKPSPMSTPIPHCTYFTPSKQPQLPIPSSERVSPPFPTYLHRSQFSIYGPAVQMDLKRSWIFKLSTAPRQFSSDFRTEDWSSATEFIMWIDSECPA
ncbi:hypothetical protein AVEN_247384-1 [Araneus ventricosus]|uniref:Uncharacterized protein n=1 Tax=Araneus ventricosus TaxID=182803 RepID=A0A4Y2UY89_ARAVE|nr:hypothetical protein AVEN_247384-1 [Araneus ventricosus]